MGISFVENVPKNLLPVFFSLIFFFYTKIEGGGGGAQAPSAPPPAMGLVIKKNIKSWSLWRSIRALHA